MPLSTRRLENSHFAFYRAYLEGPDALDLAALADRYLDCGRDPRRVRALLRWLQDEFAAAARRNGDWEALRLLRLPKSLEHHDDHADASFTPSLTDFAAQVDPDNVYGEAELIGLYREHHPKADNRRAAKTARLRERRLAALRRLQHISVDAPQPGHAVDGWFDANVVMRMHRAGIATLAQLCETINGNGVRWYRDIPHLGPIGAARIVRWVQANAMSLGGLVSRHCAEGGFTASVAIPARGAIVPIETLASQGLPAALSGSEGTNRSLNAERSIAAETDVAAICIWLDAQAGSAHTRRAYRTQAERILLWSIVERGKPLSSLNAEDIAAYRDFIMAPPTSWIAARHTPRWSVRWRPFAGPLTESSRATASNVLKALFRWLVTVGYLHTDPWRAWRDAVAPRLASSSSSVADAQQRRARVAIGVDTRIPVRVERVVAAMPWQALMAFAKQSDRERDHRAFCMLALSHAAGLRLQEISALRLRDVRFPRDASGVCTIAIASEVRKKVIRSATTRILDLPSWVTAALRRYIEMRGEVSTTGLHHHDLPLFMPLASERYRSSQPDRAVGSDGLPASPDKGRMFDRARVGIPMHASALARAITEFVEAVAKSIENDEPILASLLRQIRTGVCRHTYTRTALIAATPTDRLQRQLGLRSKTTINAHRRALAGHDAARDRVGY
ncbi:phage integrase family protein [Robbsia andropogonis]|uniref:phage integrase family protein n=1 Tax=Robbsia andropogonis TaxID=28092 RepID=UPI003D214AE2